MNRKGLGNPNYTLSLALLLLVLGSLLSSCGTPLFMSDDELFRPNPELIAYLRPYLERWSGKPWEMIEDEVREIEHDSSTFFSIGIRTVSTTTGDTIPILTITLDGFHDWSRGYFYVPEGVALQESPGLRLRQVDEHFYLFSLNL